MTNVDTGSYSCKELVDYLEVHGTEREIKLIERFEELQVEIDSANEEYRTLDFEFDELNDEISQQNSEIEDLEETIVELKDEIKELTKDV